MHREIYMRVFIDTKNYNSLERLTKIHAATQGGGGGRKRHPTEAHCKAPFHRYAQRTPPSVYMHALPFPSAQRHAHDALPLKHPSDAISFHLYLCSPPPSILQLPGSSPHPVVREIPLCVSARRSLPEPHGQPQRRRLARPYLLPGCPGPAGRVVADGDAEKASWERAREGERGSPAPPASLIPPRWGGDCGWRGGGGAPTASNPPLAAAAWPAHRRFIRRPSCLPGRASRGMAGRPPLAFSPLKRRAASPEKGSPFLLLAAEEEEEGKGPRLKRSRPASTLRERARGKEGSAFRRHLERRERLARETQRRAAPYTQPAFLKACSVQESCFLVVLKKRALIRAIALGAMSSRPKSWEPSICTRARAHTRVLYIQKEFQKRISLR